MEGLYHHSFISLLVLLPLGVKVEKEYFMMNSLLNNYSLDFVDLTANQQIGKVANQQIGRVAKQSSKANTSERNNKFTKLYCCCGRV